MAKLHHALLLLVSLASHADADIKTLSVTSDPLSFIFLHRFAFTRRGQVSVSAFDFSVASSSLCAPDPSASGIFLLSEDALPQVLHDAEQDTDFCILHSRYIMSLFTLRDLPAPPHPFFNGTYPVTHPGVYSMFFANCNPEARVSMNVRTELYNLDSDGSKNYLSDGESRLIPLYLEFSVVFFLLLVLWAYYCYCNRAFLNTVHLLIAGSITVKTLSLICAGLDKYFVELTGTLHGWEIMFGVARAMSSLIIIVLVMIGFWSVKQFLQEEAAKVVIATIALQVLPSVAFPFVMTMGDTWPDIWRVLVWLHAICTCTVLVITGRSHWLLRKAAKNDEKAATSLAKVEKFAWLYVLAADYLYEIAVFADLLRMVMAYEYSWVSNAAEEGANLMIFVAMLCMFRPVNEYTILDAQDDKEETMAVTNEESKV